MNLGFMVSNLFMSVDLTSVTNPIVSLIKSVTTPALTIVGALGAIYCIILGAKLAKAEEPQDREKAKNSLKNAIIGFVLIFVLLFALFQGLPIMMQWLDSATTAASVSYNG